jgi:superfamily I DNA/RNA helicase
MVNELEDWCMSQGFSFTSVNRNPLKSKSFDAIRRWENLRKGKDEAPGAVVDVLKFVFPSLAPPTLTNWLKSLAPDAMVGMPELTTNGLKTTDIWHRALGKLPVKDRDFFIAAAQRREPMLKEPRIRISTIHAAKGGEAEHVLLTTDMSYRIWSKMQDEPDDELRCWFVGATRCKESLHIVMPRTNMAFEF